MPTTQTISQSWLIGPGGYFVGDPRDPSYILWHVKGPELREPVEVVPLLVAERYRDALGLLRAHVKDDEGWKLINDALWLGARDENDEPIRG